VVSWDTSCCGHKRSCGREERLRGLVFRLTDYRSRGPGFDSRLYQIFWEAVGPEPGPRRLLRINEALFDQ
jgi:hypothetical protein